MRPRIDAALLLGVVVTATFALAQKAPDVRVDTGSPPGAGQVYYPQIAAAGSAVHVVWMDGRNGQPNPYYNRSVDGGATWQPSDVRLDAGSPPGASWGEDVQLAASGNAVYVVWAESAIESGARVYRLMFDRSLDGGLTWLPQALRMYSGTLPGGGRVREPQVTADGAVVQVAWRGSRNSSIGLWFTASFDGGTTWFPAEVRVDHPPSATWLSTVLGARIASSGATVCAVWAEDRSVPIGSQPNVYCNCSADRGLTWLPQDVRLDVGVPVGAGTGWQPAIACDGAGVYVAWGDGRNGGGDIFLQRSLDRGSTWLASEVRLDTGSAPGAASSALARIAATGAGVFVCWVDMRNGNGDIYLNRSVDRGTSWLATDVRLDTGSPPGVDMAFDHQLAAAGSTVVVAWADTRHSSLPATPFDIYLNRSLDAGASWLPSDVRIDLGDPPGVVSAYSPQLSVSGDSAYVVWRELRTSTDANARFNLAFGWQPYGIGTPGGAGVVPVLEGHGAPAIGGAMQCVVRRGVGGAPGVLLAGFGPASQVAVPFAGGTLLVSPSLALPIQLSGPVGAPGAGAASITVPLPGDPALLGSNLDLQGLFVDDDACGGLSMTRALAAWIG